MPRARIGKVTPQQAGAAWNAGFQAGAANAQAGVQNPKASWSQSLLREKNTVIGNLQQAFSNGTWEQGVQRTGDQGWQQAMIQKGIPHMQQGSQLGAQHYAAFRSQWDPAVQQMVNQLPARGDYATNKQRSSNMQDMMHAVRGKYRKLWRGGAIG